MIYPVYKLKGSILYIIEIDITGEEYLYLSTTSTDVREKTLWKISKTPKDIYESNRKKLIKVYECEVDEENIAIAMLTDRQEVFI